MYSKFALESLGKPKEKIILCENSYKRQPILYYRNQVLMYVGYLRKLKSSLCIMYWLRLHFLALYFDKKMLVLVGFDIGQKVMPILSFGFRLNHFSSNILRNSSVNYNGCPYNGIIEIPMLST